MDLTGARWSLTGAEAILRLRALKSSGDFDEYWRFHEAQEKKRNHAARYKDGIIPKVVVPDLTGRSRFRLVKLSDALPKAFWSAEAAIEPHPNPIASLSAPSLKNYIKKGIDSAPVIHNHAANLTGIWWNINYCLYLN